MRAVDLPMRKVAMKMASAPRDVTLLPMRGIIVIGSSISYICYLASILSF